MLKIPFLDVRATYLELRDELDAAFRRVMQSGEFILGDEVEAFENEWAEFCGVKHCVGVGNGLDALRLALLAVGVGRGDEVIVPSNTYIATWMAVSQAGAKPVPVEPNRETFNLDPDLLEATVSSKTKAIIPVHLYGQPADIDPIVEVAGRHRIAVVEDAAQSHGAVYKGRRTGGLGEVAGWSFYPSKNLGAFGDGGAITTNDDRVAQRVRVLRNYGSVVKYKHEYVGYNSRLDPLQAAFLRVKLRNLDEWNKRRQLVARTYLDALKSEPGLTLPSTIGGCVHAWHLFVVRHPRRDELQAALNESGVESSIHYPIPPHLSGSYSSGDYRALAIAVDLSRTVLSLPLGPHLSDDAQSRVIEAVLTSVRLPQVSGE